ncbi:MAG: 2-C-methyl-D-erythritol 4-phosphate cytidylyltransferase [Alistipes sp.]|nr:2-C-methyl-D-erythritol 4-phosphate cytidylyltransferase [Alistipes sp.]
MVAALILSGGTGSRLGSDIPKQYIDVAGRSILSYSIETLSKSGKIDMMWIVAAPEWRGTIKEELEIYDRNHKCEGFSLPGENRQLSVFNGISDIKKWIDGRGASGADPARDIVLIHDGARPMLSEKDVGGYVEAIAGHDGVLPVLAMKDTIYYGKNGKLCLLDRSGIFAGQAPELFVLDKYIKANKRLIRFEGETIADDSLIFKINGSTEPAVMAGMDIVTVPGNERNFKITTKEDLERFKQIVSTG